MPSPSAGPVLALWEEMLYSMGEEQKGLRRPRKEASGPHGPPTGGVLSQDPGAGGQGWERAAWTKAGMVRTEMCWDGEEL